MNEWEKKLLEKAREVVKWGWGEINISVSANGRRLTTSQKFTEVEENLTLKNKSGNINYD